MRVRSQESGVRRAKHNIFIIIAVLMVALAAGASAAWASSEEGEAPRRIQTGNVNDAHDIEPIGETGHEGEVKALEEPQVGEGAPEALSGAIREEAADSAAKEEGHGSEGAAEEGHHPAWQIPGWQSIFTLLAVAYYALAVKVLPRIMAKENH